MAGAALLTLLATATGCTDHALLRWHRIAAREALAKGRAAEALARAEALLDADPADEGALELAVKARIALVGPRRAVDALHAESALAPDDAGRAYAYVLAYVAARTTSTGDPSDERARLRASAEEIESIAARYPSHAPLAVLRARLTAARGNHGLAVRRALEAAALDPKRTAAAVAVFDLAEGRGLRLRQAIRAGVRRLPVEAKRRLAQVGGAWMLSVLRRFPSTKAAIGPARTANWLADCAALAEETSGPCVGASLHQRVARLLLGTRYAARSRAIFSAAVERCGRDGRSPGLYVVHLDSLGGLSKLSGDFRAAARHFERAAELVAKAGDRRRQVEYLTRATLDRINLGETERALALIGSALRIAKALGDRRLLAATWHTVGSARTARVDLRGAVRAFERAAAIFERLGRTKERASAYADLGRVLSSLGEHDRAVRVLEECLALHGPDDRSGQASALVNLGAAYRARGDPVRALGLYRRAARLLHEYPYLRRYEAVAVGNIGNVYASIGMYERALEYHRRALALKKGTANVRELAESTEAIARSLSSLGKADEAERHARRALALYVEAGSLGQAADCRVYLASLLLGGARRAEGLTLLGEALAAQEKLGLRVGVADTLLLRAIHFTRHERRDEALADLARVDAIDRALGAKARWQTAYLRGQLLRSTAPAASLQALREAAARLDAYRGRFAADAFKTTFLSRVTFVYHALAEAALAADATSKGVEMAFDAVERGKARGLLDLLSGRERAPAQGRDAERLKGALAALEARATRLQKAIAAAGAPSNDAAARALARLQEARDRTLGEADVLGAERSAAGEVAAASRPGRAASLAELRAVLPPRTVFVEYSVGERSALVVAVDGERAIARSVPIGRDALAAKVEAFRALLRAPEVRRPKAFARAAHALHALLLGPVADFVPRGAALVIAPDGPLAYLPFETLRPSLEGDLLTPRYLLDERAVSYAPSGSVLVALAARARKTPPARRGLVALGDPIYDFAAYRAGRAEGDVDALATARGPAKTRALLGRLPATADEVRRIAALVDGPKALLLRADAREERLKAGALRGQRLIHFATHGLVSDSFQALALTLDPSSREDGFLELREIRRLALDAELVTLSACQTGEGRLVSGEGVVGLTHAFLFAGAARLVVSLWQVADLATAELMVRMYGALGPAGAPRVAEALRKAKLALRADPRFAHPYYWAAFVATGLP